MRTIEHFRAVIKGNETTVERDMSYINHRGDLQYMTTISKSISAEGDVYNKNIGIVVAILKSLGFSRRIIRLISDILLQEAQRKSK